MDPKHERRVTAPLTTAGFLLAPNQSLASVTKQQTSPESLTPGRRLSPHRPGVGSPQRKQEGKEWSHGRSYR
jgi:hypothetical protein